MHANTRLENQDLWTEIARPQIHGYDMTDAAFISPYRFASTGDEKVTRVFDAPGGYVESLHSLGVSTDSQDSVSTDLWCQDCLASLYEVVTSERRYRTTAWTVEPRSGARCVNPRVKNAALT